MKRFCCLFAVAVCSALANTALACQVAATVVSGSEVVVPVQPAVAVQALAVPSVALVSPTILATPVVTSTVVVDEVVRRRVRPLMRVRGNRVRVNVR